MKRWVWVGLVVVVVAAAGAWHWLRPTDPLRQANKLLQAGQLRSAQLVLRDAVLSHPRDGRLHAALAEVEMRSQDPIGAEREARAAAQNGWNPNAIAVLLAQAGLQQGHFQDVLSTYQPSPTMTPAQQATILVQRGLAQFALGQPAAAAASIADAQRREPRSYAAAMAAARIARASNDPATARRQLDLAVSIIPHDPQALLMRGQVQLAAGDPNDALADDNEAVAYSGGVAALLGRADLLTGMGEVARARADIDAVLKASPNNPYGEFLLARVLIATGDWAGADAALDKAGRLVDQLPRGQLYMAVVKANLKQPQQALDAAQSYRAKVGLSDPDVAGLIASLYLQTNRPGDAVALLAPLAASGRANAGLRTLLAKAYAQSGTAPPAQDAAAPTGAVIQGGTVNASLTQDTGTIARADPAADPVAETVSQIRAAVQAGQPDQAAGALDRLRALKGVDPVQVDTLQGMVNLARSDLAGAHAAFAAAVKADPDDVGAQTELARVIALQGDPAQADRLLSALADKNPTNLAVLSALQAVETQAGQTDPLTRRYIAAHNAAPADLRLTMALAQFYAQTGRAPQALAVVDEAVRAATRSASASAPSVPPMLLELQARLQMQQAQPKDAVKTLRQLLAQQPANALVTQQLIQAQLAVGDIEGARALVRDALTKNPGSEVLLAASVGIASRQGVEAGLAMADQLAREKANLPTALVLKGDLLATKQRYDEAVAAYRSAQTAPPSGIVATRIAIAQQAAGKQAEALTGLRQFLADHPDDAEVAQMLSGIDIAARRYDQARAELNVVLKTHPSEPNALNNMAWIEQQSGNLAGARQTAQRAYLLRPTAQAADTLGWVLLQLGDAQDAMPLLRQAGNGLRTDPGVQYHLARALQQTGHAAEALTILTTLDARPGTFDEKPEADKLRASLTH